MDSSTEMKEHVAREECREDETDSMIKSTHENISEIKERITRARTKHILFAEFEKRIDKMKKTELIEEMRLKKMSYSQIIPTFFNKIFKNCISFYFM